MVASNDGQNDKGRELPDLEDSIEKRPDERDGTYEMGASSNFPTTSWSSFSFNKDFGLARTGIYKVGSTSDHVSLDNIRNMRLRDGQTRALFRMFQLPIMTCLKEGEWIRDPSTVSGAGDGEKEVAYANAVFKTPLQSGGMEIPIRLILEQLLLALIESSSTFEIVNDTAVKGPMKGLWFPRRIAHRDLKTLEPLVNKWGDFVGVHQVARRPDGTLLDTVIEKNNLLRYVCNEAEAPLTGVSMFESAWFHFDIKKKLYYIAHIAAQFAAVPGRLGNFAPGASAGQREQFRNALTSFGFGHNSSLIMPDGYKVTSFNSNTGFDFMKLIDHHNHQQSKSVLLQFMDNDTRMAVIENGGQDASADMFVQALRAIMDEISDVFTHQLMPKYIDWNFKSDNYPIWRFAPLTDSSKDTIKEVFSSFAVSQTLNITPELFRELEKKFASTNGLDIDYATIEKGEEAAAEKAAAIAQAQAEALDLRAQLESGQSNPNNPAPSQDPSSSAPGIGDTNNTAALSGEAYLGNIDSLYKEAQKLFLSEPEVFGL